MNSARRLFVGDPIMNVIEFLWNHSDMSCSYVCSYGAFVICN